jgi:hypothetical protein
MLMKKIIHWQRPIVTLLLPLLLVLFLREPARGGMNPPDDISTTNMKWSLKDNVITINYDLNGSPNDKYHVDIVMKKEHDGSFNVVPKSVEGDIGEGLFSGTNREIRWYFINDYPQGLKGEGYYFEIHVKVVGSENNWMYYALGAVAVAGGVVALFVGKSSTNPPLSPSNTELPAPPGRPH